MEKIVYQGKLLEIVEKEVVNKDKKRIFEFVRRSPGVRLIIEKNNSILISKEYRHEINGYDYRLPGGKVFDLLKEYNETLAREINIRKKAEETAIKEAREETGVVVKKIDFFYKSICGATMEWDLYYFIVKDFEEKEQELEEDEDITCEFIDRKKVEEMCLDGKMSEDRSSFVLLRYLKNTS